VPNGRPSPAAPRGRCRSGMDPRVCASASLRLHLGMTKVGMASTPPFVILGLDPRIHAGTLVRRATVSNGHPSPAAPRGRCRSGMDPRVCASASLRLRPRMTKVSVAIMAPRPVTSA
jgi:hypothetical protein